MQPLQLFPLIRAQPETNSLCLKLVLPAAQQVRPNIQTPCRLCNPVALLGKKWTPYFGQPDKCILPVFG